jgi:tyrosinase
MSSGFWDALDVNSPAFDPIFFLHHANVDRMLSLWAAVNPGVWVASGLAEGGTWTISGNATIDSNTSMPYSPRTICLVYLQ